VFVIEAADTVQAQNDFIAAITGLNKARSALDLAQIQHKRAKDLFEARPVPLKGLSAAEANDPGAERPALDGRRRWRRRANKLANLGFTDEAISTFQDKAASIGRSPSSRRLRHRCAAEDRPGQM